MLCRYVMPFSSYDRCVIPFKFCKTEHSMVYKSLCLIFVQLCKNYINSRYLCTIACHFISMYLCMCINYPKTGIICICNRNNILIHYHIFLPGSSTDTFLKVFKYIVFLFPSKTGIAYFATQDPAIKPHVDNEEKSGTQKSL